jgi:predicted amidohydrolase
MIDPASGTEGVRDIVIEDGKISEINIKILNVSKKDINKIIKKNKLRLEDVLVGTLDDESNFIYQLKEEVGNND